MTRLLDRLGGLFERIGDAVAALPVESAVLDGESILLRPDNTSDFEALGSRQGQAEAILVAYDIMEMDGQDVRPEPLEERRKRLARLLSRSNKALRDGIQRARQSLETAPPSSAMRAGWSSKASSPNASARGT